MFARRTFLCASIAAASLAPMPRAQGRASMTRVRRQSIWDKRADDLRESLAHLGFQFRRRFCGVASAVV
jgi:hypothetical protein